MAHIEPRIYPKRPYPRNSSNDGSLGGCFPCLPGPPTAPLLLQPTYIITRTPAKERRTTKHDKPTTRKKQPSTPQNGGNDFPPFCRLPAGSVVTARAVFPLPCKCFVRPPFVRLFRVVPTRRLTPSAIRCGATNRRSLLRRSRRRCRSSNWVWLAQVQTQRVRIRSVV